MDTTQDPMPTNMPEANAPTLPPEALAPPAAVPAPEQGGHGQNNLAHLPEANDTFDFDDFGKDWE